MFTSSGSQQCGLRAGGPTQTVGQLGARAAHTVLTEVSARVSVRQQGPEGERRGVHHGRAGETRRVPRRNDVKPSRALLTFATPCPSLVTPAPAPHAARRPPGLLWLAPSCGQCWSYDEKITLTGYRLWLPVARQPVLPMSTWVVRRVGGCGAQAPHCSAQLRLCLYCDYQSAESQQLPAELSVQG